MMGIFLGLGVFEILTLAAVVVVVAAVSIVVGYVLGKRDKSKR